MAADELSVRGLREFRREITKANPKMRRLVGRAHKEIGDRIIAGPAQRRMQSVAKGRGGYLGARGIKASSSSTRMQVALSGANVRVRGDEFGSHRRQFRPWKGNQWTGLDPGQAGYAVQPTIRENRQKIIDEYMDSVWDSLRRAFPEGR